MKQVKENSVSEDRSSIAKAKWVIPAIVDLDDSLGGVAAGDGATVDGTTANGTS